MNADARGDLAAPQQSSLFWQEWWGAGTGSHYQRGLGERHSASWWHSSAAVKWDHCEHDSGWTKETGDVTCFERQLTVSSNSGEPSWFNLVLETHTEPPDGPEHQDHPTFLLSPTWRPAAQTGCQDSTLKVTTT